MKKIRCAIYTRKSAEEGLEQDFNSLDAQREACAAYVASQKAEGWVLLPTVYEDAGLSGGTLERPGLQRLLADIDASLVDQIVVYKVDRLTRSLSDFAKLVERLEAAGAVFVSVTQSFNTATSMGRLTLHMLCLLFIHPRAPNLIRVLSKNTNELKTGAPGHRRVHLSLSWRAQPSRAWQRVCVFEHDAHHLAARFELETST